MVLCALMVCPAFAFTINRPAHKIDNRIDNRLPHHIIAGSGLTFPPDNFQQNQLADFLERRLPPYLKHCCHAAAINFAVLIDVFHNPHLSFRQADLAFLFRLDTFRIQTGNTLTNRINAYRQAFFKIFQPDDGYFLIFLLKMNYLFHHLTDLIPPTAKISHVFRKSTGLT
jgi:hypothetical protein